MFRPQDGIPPETFFAAQLGLLSEAVTKNCFILGNFKLDARMELRNDYVYKVPFRLLSNFVTEKTLYNLSTLRLGPEPLMVREKSRH